LNKHVPKLIQKKSESFTYSTFICTWFKITFITTTLKMLQDLYSKEHYIGVQEINERKKIRIIFRERFIVQAFDNNKIILR